MEMWLAERWKRVMGDAFRELVVKALFLLALQVMPQSQLPLWVDLGCLRARSRQFCMGHAGGLQENQSRRLLGEAVERNCSCTFFLCVCKGKVGTK